MNNAPQLSEKESIVGVRWEVRDGKHVLVQDVRYKDGSVKPEVIESPKANKGELTDNHNWDKRWEDTQTIPQDISSDHTNALSAKSDRLVPPQAKPDHPAMESAMIRRSIMRETEQVMKMTSSKTSSSGRSHFIQQHIDRSLMLHAKLIKWLGATPEEILEDHKTIRLNNSALYEVITDVIKVVGDPWEDVLMYVKCVDPRIQNALNQDV